MPVSPLGRFPPLVDRRFRVSLFSPRPARLPSPLPPVSPPLCPAYALVLPTIAKSMGRECPSQGCGELPLRQPNSQLDLIFAPLTVPTSWH